MPRNPQGGFSLAHAVISTNDYFGNIFKESYAVRETILVDFDFFYKIRNAVTFKDAGSDVGKATNPQLRAVALLHEARHLYSLTGHGADPA